MGIAPCPCLQRLRYQARRSSVFTFKKDLAAHIVEGDQTRWARLAEGVLPSFLIPRMTDANYVYFPRMSLPSLRRILNGVPIATHLEGVSVTHGIREVVNGRLEFARQDECGGAWR